MNQAGALKDEANVFCVFHFVDKSHENTKTYIELMLLTGVVYQNLVYLIPVCHSTLLPKNY